MRLTFIRGSLPSSGIVLKMALRSGILAPSCRSYTSLQSSVHYSSAVTFVHPMAARPCPVARSQVLVPEDARQQRGLITVQAAAGDFNTYEVI